MFIAAQFTIPSYGSSLGALKLMKGLRNYEILYIYALEFYSSRKEEIV
jgi:hypothetical protein